MQGHEDDVATVRENCLSFHVTAAKEIRKKLPVDSIFLSHAPSICVNPLFE